MFLGSSTEHYSTITTMKVFLLFALFGLGFCQDSNDTTCSTSPSPYAGDSDCMEKSLQEFAEAMYVFGIYLCKYRSLSEGGNYEDFKTSATQCIKVMKCLGCTAESIFGNATTFNDVLMEISETSEGVFGSAQKLVDPLPFDETAAKIFCFLIGPVFTSDCLQYALKNLTTGLLDDLKNLFCEIQNNEEIDVAAKFTAILIKSDCAFHKQQENGDILENNFGLLGNYLKPLIEKMLLLTQKVPPVAGEICGMHNPQLPGGSLIEPV